MNCESVLLEKCDRLLLKVINHRYTWAFVVDLLTKEVFADFGLLCLWGLRQDYDFEIVPTVETWLADSELAALTLDSVTDISDRLLAKSIKLVNLKLDSTDTNGLMVVKFITLSHIPKSNSSDFGFFLVIFAKFLG